MSDIKKNIEQLANEIGSLVIKNGLSYNQTKKVFDYVLEQLKNVPYQSSGSSRE